MDQAGHDGRSRSYDNPLQHIPSQTSRPQGAEEQSQSSTSQTENGGP